MYVYEAFKMAIAAIWSHKLRSFLTLVGIIAGIASIIAVMTGISVIQKTIEKEMSVLGTQTFQVQKWANGPVSREEMLKIIKRRPTTIEQANAIRERVKTVDLVGSELWSQNRHQAKYRDISTNSNLTICGATPEYPENNTHYVRLGRNISNEDVRIGRKVVVLGHAVAEKLFPWTDPTLKIIKIDGLKFQVIGVLEEKKSAFGGNFDNYMLIPISRFKRIFGMKDSRGRDLSVNITVRAKSPELLQDAIAETRSVMRMERGLKPSEEDDFTIFTNDSNIKTFNQQTEGIKVGAFVIGIVALVVAGIGIMNIMFVSVTERTKEIGIRKSLGAKRKNILMQFLLEAIIMCNIGGVIGVGVGIGLGNIISILTKFAATIPIGWAIVGLIFCTSIGLSFGFWPAYKASKLDPIVALRYE